MRNSLVTGLMPLGAKLHSPAAPTGAAGAATLVDLRAAFLAEGHCWRVRLRLGETSSTNRCQVPGIVICWTRITLSSGGLSSLRSNCGLSCKRPSAYEAGGLAAVNMDSLSASAALNATWRRNVV